MCTSRRTVFFTLAALFILFPTLSLRAVMAEDLSLTVVYDNNPYQKGLEARWGFACFIKGTEKTILFDVGGEGSS